MKKQLGKTSPSCFFQQIRRRYNSNFYFAGAHGIQMRAQARTRRGPEDTDTKCRGLFGSAVLIWFGSCQDIASTLRTGAGKRNARTSCGQPECVTDLKTS